MGQTTYFGMDYPDENQDPYFDRIENFFMQIDQNFFAMTTLNQPMLGGGVVSLTNLSVPPNPYVGQLIWTQDFEMMIPASGFSFFVKFGPDGLTRSVILNDGDRLIVTIPYISSANISANFTKISGPITSQPQTGLWTLGIYRAGVFYSNLPKTFP